MKQSAVLSGGAVLSHKVRLADYHEIGLLNLFGINIEHFIGKVSTGVPGNINLKIGLSRNESIPGGSRSQSGLWAEEKLTIFWPPDAIMD